MERDSQIGNINNRLELPSKMSGLIRTKLLGVIALSPKVSYSNEEKPDITELVRDMKIQSREDWKNISEKWRTGKIPDREERITTPEVIPVQPNVGLHSHLTGEGCNQA